MSSSMANFVPNHQRTSTGLEKAASAAKTLFLTVGIASTAILMGRFAFPYLLTLMSSSLPRLRHSLVSWFAPPYLFVTVHFIIMVIWKLHGNQRPDDADDAPAPVTAEAPAEISVESHPAEPEPEESPERHRPWPPPEETKEIIEEETDYTVTTSPDGMDATWRAIMSGKSTPFNKQLKKSDTWERTSHAPPPSPKTLTRAAARADSREFCQSGACRDHVDGGGAKAKKEMRKSKTFREPRGAAAGNAGWRGRDVLVVGRDELFGRVEAFIKMNYDQMRLQRREAEQRRYVEMSNAAY